MAGSISREGPCERPAYEEDCYNGACDGRPHPLPPSRDYPLLKSLLLTGGGSSSSTADIAACVVTEQVRRSLVSPGRQQVALAAGRLSGTAMSAGAALSPGVLAEADRTRCAPAPLRRRLDAWDAKEIQKVTKLFRRAWRAPPCCRLQPAPLESHTACVDSMDHLAMHIKAAVLSLLHFCCQFPEFRRKPPYVQIALVKAVSAESLVLRSAEYYDCSRGCWLDAHGSAFGPRDLARLMPSSAPLQLWDDIAALSSSLRSLLFFGGDGEHRWDRLVVRGGTETVVANDASLGSSFALLQAVLLMSPESVPYRRERDREIAADVSDFQQACILLLRHHLEASLSVARAAQLLPTLLDRLQTIRSLASSVRAALLSEEAVRRDRVLVDALTQSGC